MVVFFFKQKTAYEMRISDWSSDVCSSDLEAGLQPGNNGNWTQDVPLVEITAKNVSPLSFTGGRAPMSLKYGTDFVAATYRVQPQISVKASDVVFVGYGINRSEEHTSELQSLMRISYAVFCLKKKNKYY